MKTPGMSIKWLEKSKNIEINEFRKEKNCRVGEPFKIIIRIVPIKTAGQLCISWRGNNTGYEDYCEIIIFLRKACGEEKDMMIGNYFVSLQQKRYLKYG